MENVIKMDKTIRLLRNKNDNLMSRIRNLRFSNYKKEAKEDLLKRYALVKKMERNHYDALHKIVDIVIEVNNKNKELIAKELADITKEYNKYK